MTVVTMIAFASPILGLVIAYMTYGSHWGELQAFSGIAPHLF